MQTPGHAVINVALLGGALGLEPAGLAGLIAGAIFPDVPILVLYAHQRLIRGTPEDEIWAVHYQRPLWLNLVHGAHSIPIGLAGVGLGAVLGSPALLAFFASMTAHALGDLPVHARDAHRHFLPLSQYRFISPISYWDPAFHGRAVALAEAVFVLLCSGWILRQTPSPAAFAVLGLVNLAYAAHYTTTFLLRSPGKVP